MRFDQKLFKTHYGKMYFRCMYYGLGLALLFMQLSYYPSFFHWNISTNVIGFFAVLTCFMLVIVVPVSGFLYFDSKRRASNQQQWIDHNSFFYRIEQRKMKNLLQSSMHTFTYEIQNIKEAKMDNRFFYINGSIHLIDEVDDLRSHQQISFVKIPRCFDNEEKLMKLLKISY